MAHATRLHPQRQSTSAALPHTAQPHIRKSILSLILLDSGPSRSHARSATHGYYCSSSCGLSYLPDCLDADAPWLIKTWLTQCSDCHRLEGSPWRSSAACLTHSPTITRNHQRLVKKLQLLP